jgi:cytosine/adenosine deaminase-related metal-dependent hydrolase
VPPATPPARPCAPAADTASRHRLDLLVGLRSRFTADALTKNLADGSGEWIDVIGDVYCRGTGESFWRVESRLAALERLRAGVTTSLSYVGSSPRVDDPKFAAAAASGYETFGLRHVVAIGPPDGLPVRYVDAGTDRERTVDLDDAMATARAVVEDLHGAADGRLSVAVALSSLTPETDDDGAATEAASEQMHRVVDLAVAEDLAVQAHAYGGDVAAAADACPDLLSPRLSLAHCAGLSEGELDIMADNGVAASHGPLTKAYVRARFPVIEAMDRGVTVAVSTDGAAPDRSFDLLEQGRIAAQLQRVHFGDSALFPAGRLLEAMTVDAAVALGLEEEVGSLEPGKREDVVAVDRESAKLGPRTHPVSRVCNYADGGDVTFAMVDGDVLMHDSVVVDSVDEAALLDDADRELRRALERVDAEWSLDQHPDLWSAVRYGR